MKKILINHYSLFILLAVALCACQKKETTSFQYNVDKFYDLEILRYDVPEFDSLSLQQKQLIYCLSEAALWGRDILFDQNGRYNLRIRRTCEALYQHLTPTLSQGEGASPLGGDGREVLDPKELALIQRLTDYPSIVRNAGENFSPAVICNYAYDLACDFNSFYHDLSILNEPDSDKRALRLLLAKNVAKVIQSALSLLGIEVPERM